MQLTRLNVLVVLGVVTVAGGALFGTGAFTTVEADRTVDVNSVGDASALLEFSDKESQLVDMQGGDDTDLLRIEEQNLNKDAVTEAEDAFNATNTGNNGVGFYVQDPGVAEIDIVNVATGESVVGAANSVDLDANGGTVDLTVVIDLTGTNDVTNVPTELTFVATTDEYGGA